VQHDGRKESGLALGESGTSASIASLNHSTISSTGAAPIPHQVICDIRRRRASATVAKSPGEDEDTGLVLGPRGQGAKRSRQPDGALPRSLSRSSPSLSVTIESRMNAGRSAVCAEASCVNGAGAITTVPPTHAAAPRANNPPTTPNTTDAASVPATSARASVVSVPA
jgi:hypothetical protein